MHYDQVRVPAEKSFTEDLDKMFNADLLRSVIREAKVEESSNGYHTMLKGHSFKITPELTPDIAAICQEVLAKLKFEEDVEFFIESSASFNAGAVSRMEEGQAHLVILHAGLVEKFSDAELRFIIGHEVGHLISKNSELRGVINFIYPPGTQMSSFLMDKIETWEKLSELTADRFGYIACPDLSVCRSVFFKLASGLGGDRVVFSEEAFQASMDEVLDYFKKSGQGLSTSHPINPIRLRALQVYADSKAFSEMNPDANPDANHDANPEMNEGQEFIDDSQLNGAMQELTDIILTKGGSELMAHRKAFLASAGLIVAGADGRYDDAEIKRILEALGSTSHFPRQFLDEIVQGGKVGEVFSQSVQAILQMNPGERYQMFQYMVDIAFTDRALDDDELKLMYDVGENMFGMQRKEVAQQIAAALQREFVPNILGD